MWVGSYILLYLTFVQQQSTEENWIACKCLHFRMHCLIRLYQLLANENADCSVLPAFVMYAQQMLSAMHVNAVVS
jgi:hypothetical protein